MGATTVERLRALRDSIKLQLPKLERKQKPAAVSRPAMVRDHRAEAETNEAVLGVFEELRHQEQLLRRFEAVKGDLIVEYDGEPRSVADVLSLVGENVRKTKELIRQDFDLPDGESLGLYPRWIEEGHLSIEDLLGVSLDLVERGALLEISEREEKEMDAVRKAYRAACDAAKDGEKPAWPEGLQRVFRVLVIAKLSPSQTESRYRFFVERQYEKGAAPAGCRKLFYAYKARFDAESKRARERHRAEDAMEADLGVDEGKTLADVEAGNPCVARVAVTRDHQWLANGIPQTGVLFVKCHGVEGGVASLEVRASGAIAWGLKREVGRIYEYKPRTRFDGIADSETKETDAKLRVFLLKVGGFFSSANNGRGGRDTLPSSSGGASGGMEQYQPKTPRGGRSDEGRKPPQARGRRPKGAPKERGGGGNRADANRFKEK